MAHIEYLKSIFSLQGQPVVDVGAGDGVYSRQLHEEGADVTAVEIEAQKVAKAKALLPADIDVRLGSAEQLPLEDGSQQLVCFFFSLHHVPMDLHDAAFSEVCRVSQPGARLHVVDRVELLDCPQHRNWAWHPKSPMKGSVVFRAMARSQ